jgi:hypothetical protein
MDPLWWKIIEIVLTILTPALAILLTGLIVYVFRKIGIKLDNETLNVLLKRANGLVGLLKSTAEKHAANPSRLEKVRVIVGKLHTEAERLGFTDIAEVKLIALAENAVDMNWPDEDQDGIPDPIDPEILKKEVTPTP